LKTTRKYRTWRRCLRQIKGKQFPVITFVQETINPIYNIIPTRRRADIWWTMFIFQCDHILNTNTWNDIKQLHSSHSTFDHNIVERLCWS
jgi:hypothetical protein